MPYGQPQSNLNDYVLHVNPKFRNMPPPNFQLSNCQGRKRALLIGINYFGTSAELRGTHILSNGGLFILKIDVTACKL